MGDIKNIPELNASGSKIGGDKSQGKGSISAGVEGH